MAPDFQRLVRREILIPWLVQKRVLDLDEIERIDSPMTLLVILYRKGDVLQRLVDSLHEARDHCGHTELLELILRKSLVLGGMFNTVHQHPQCQLSQKSPTHTSYDLTLLYIHVVIP